jgi:nucleoside-diphosphate-sugar epimerase
MRILFTGSSSFTGYWFIKELVSAGHHVAAIFQRANTDYPDEVRRNRVKALIDLCHPIFGVSFGDDQFLKLIQTGNWDVLCHHAADATNYRSPDFDIAAAVANNTHRLPLVLDTLKDSGCNKVVLTGSIFENDEGAGSPHLEAFSPYGLSKGLTWQTFRYFSRSRQITLGKFVIPNPFGPYEEPRFTHYLFKCWFSGTAATVNTPSYVRDNIHVSLLAKVYLDFIETLPVGFSHIHPSGYIGQQGQFALQLAREMRARLGLPCEIELNTQTDFSEPRIRINTDTIQTNFRGWSEPAAWDDLAEYYKTLMSNSD